ncbi:MAG: signal recognition particle protein, partial [Alphaproteobacteria bacterium]
LPGVGKLKKQMAEHNLDDSLIKRQEAIILSMTPLERAKPATVKASRKVRIAAGSGTSVQEINKLLKQYQQMQSMMKKMKKMGGRIPPMGGGGMPSMGGGLPPGMLPPGMGR